MSDVRIPYGQSRGRRFVSLILHWTQWDALNGTFSMIKTCSDIEDDRKTNFSKYRYIYIRP